MPSPSTPPSSVSSENSPTRHRRNQLAVYDALDTSWLILSHYATKPDRRSAIATTNVSPVTRSESFRRDGAWAESRVMALAGRISNTFRDSCRCRLFSLRASERAVVGILIGPIGTDGVGGGGVGDGLRPRRCQSRPRRRFDQSGPDAESERGGAVGGIGSSAAEMLTV